MENRTSHVSLVPQWVMSWARDCEIPSKATASHRFERFMMYFGLAFLAVVPSATIWMLTAVYFQTLTHQPIVSAWWILALPVAVTLAYGAVRFSAFRWLRSNWRAVTGEEGLEQYLYPTTATANRCKETLRHVAWKVRNGEIPPERFHLARDIAAFHWLCDRDLRIRDLAR